MLRAQGDLSEALESYRASMVIAERLAEAWERVAEAHFEEALAFVLDIVTMNGAH